MMTGGAEEAFFLGVLTTIFRASSVVGLTHSPDRLSMGVRVLPGQYQAWQLTILG